MANADVFSSMMGGGPGTPSQAESREPMVDTSIRKQEPVAAPAEAAKPRGYYRGSGGYEYLVDNDGFITIVKSKDGRKGGTVLRPDETDDVRSRAYDAIMAEVKTLPASGVPQPVQAEVKRMMKLPDPEVGTASAAPAKKAAPSGRASAAEKEAYGDELMGPMDTVGQYGSAIGPQPAPVSGSQGAKRLEAERAMETMTGQKYLAQEIIDKDLAASKEARAKEMAQYAASGPGMRTGVNVNFARARLIEDASEGLVKQGLDANAARRVAENIAKGIDTGEYSSLTALKRLASM